MSTTPYVRGYLDAYHRQKFAPGQLRGRQLEAYTSGHADGHCDAVCPDRPGFAALGFAFDTTRNSTGISRGKAWITLGIFENSPGDKTGDKRGYPPRGRSMRG